VEVAVAFPLLIFIGIAMLQFAIFYYAHNVVVAAVQEGAHVAAGLDGNFDAGQARAEAIIQAGLGPSLRSDIKVHRPETVRANDPDEAVRLEAEGSMPTFIPWFSGHRGRLELPLDAQAEVSVERFRAPR